MAGTRWQLTVGEQPNFTFTYSQQEARRVLCGFALSGERLRWQPVHRIGVQPTVATQFKWAYRIYDCVPSTTPNLTVEDVAITAALNSRIGARTMLTIAAIADDVSKCLKAVATQPPFCQLPRTDLIRYPAGSSPAAPLWNAWALIRGVAGADIAIPHKVLHRKRPDYFPLLDGNTVLAYKPKQAWAGIWDNLRNHENEFATLEAWFRGQAQAHDGKELTRLRIHDILLWARVSGQFQALTDAGAALGC
jgi:hypothetical protein